MSMRVKIEGEEAIKEALEQVANEEVHWAMFGYASKNTLKFLHTGNGINTLVDAFPEKEIVYTVISQRCPMQGTEVLKQLLLTMVGSRVSAITKARSSAHRGEFGDIVKSFIPLASHFQANEVEEICEEEFLSKLRVDPQARAAWKRGHGQNWGKGQSGTSKITNTNFGDVKAVKERVNKHKEVAETVERKRMEGTENPEPVREELDLSAIQDDLPDDAPSQGDDGPVPIEEPAEVQQPPEDVGAADGGPADDGPAADAPAADADAPAADDGAANGGAADDGADDDGGLQFCGECGVPREGDDLFCGECGCRYE